jgi:tetratricopeptide (TPR) repeat protein
MAPLSRSRRTLGLFTCFLLTPAVAFACLWDRDTIKQEQYHFPETLELITGKFLRHSKEFYQWRIEDRIAKLKAAPQNLAYLDDLAVAYEKVGDHAKAIETILKKEDIQPGIYETYSNLGTFHILAGEFDKGLPFVDKALVINPDAHFGREKYQKWLVEYAMERMKNGKLTFPMREVPEEPKTEYYERFGFHAFLAKRLDAKDEYVGIGHAERWNAIKGVLGMMRFANHENPLLLEALGDLLFEGIPQDDGKFLATRAYLKASEVVVDPEAKRKYRALAQQALYPKPHPGMITKITLPEIEESFRQELAEARKWYDDLRDSELGWIREGKDVETEFDKLYVTEPQIEGQTPPTPLSPHTRVLLWIGGILFALTAGIALIVWRTLRAGK